jgi:hypothetical protein
MSETASPNPELFDKIVNLSKRRGFVFQSAEIYGGFRSTYDYGPLGVLLLRNVKDAWWRSMVQERHDEPQATAVRYRPDREVVPKRDHAGQLRVPHS